MEKSEALDLLRSPVPLERLRAARALARSVGSADREFIASVLGSEPDSWVRHALKKTIERIDGTTPVDRFASSLPEIRGEDEQFLSDVRAQITEEISRMLLHELRPLVGTVDSSAASEIPDFASSRTSTSIEHVKLFLEAIDRLNEVSAAPNPQEFDLGEVIYEAAKAETGRLDKGDRGQRQLFLGATEEQPAAERDWVVLARRDPVVVVGDPHLVSIAVANVLRNAIEATIAAGANAPVVVNFGVTDRDAWIAVLDEGVGLPEGSDQVFEIGRSTKPKGRHHGLGLTIARRAMDNVRGSIELRPRHPRGTEASLRWPNEGSG